MTIINNFLGRANARGNARPDHVSKTRTFSGEIGTEVVGELSPTQILTRHPSSINWKAGYAPTSDEWRSVCYGN